MNQSDLAGFWEVTSSRIRNEDGTWFDDPVSGGRIAFSAGESFCIFFRSTQGAWGYSGSYRTQGEKLFMKIDSCIAEEIEGQILERDIQILSANEFFYRGTEFHTGRAFEARMTRVN